MDRITGQERVKLFVRRGLAAMPFYSRLNTPPRFLMRRNQIVVLMYHRVMEQADLNGAHLQPGMYVTKETFSIQMEYLAKHYDVISMEKFLEIMKNGDKIPANTCVLTFDDGWKDA